VPVNATDKEPRFTGFLWGNQRPSPPFCAISKLINEVY
jgi:hypothetical protein